MSDNLRMIAVSFLAGLGISLWIFFLMPLVIDGIVWHGEYKPNDNSGIGSGLGVGGDAVCSPNDEEKEARWS